MAAAVLSDLPLELLVAVAAWLPLLDQAALWRTCRRMLRLRDDYLLQPPRTREGRLLRWAAPRMPDETVLVYGARLTRLTAALRQVARAVHAAMEHHSPFINSMIDVELETFRRKEPMRRQMMMRGTWLLHGLLERARNGHPQDDASASGVLARSLDWLRLSGVAVEPREWARAFLGELTFEDLRMLDKFTRAMCATLHERLVAHAGNPARIVVTASKVETVLLAGMRAIHAVLVQDNRNVLRLVSQVQRSSFSLQHYNTVTAIHDALLGRLEPQLQQPPHPSSGLREQLDHLLMSGSVERQLTALPEPLQDDELRAWPTLPVDEVALDKEREDEADLIASLPFWSDYYPALQRQAVSEGRSATAAESP